MKKILAVDSNIKNFERHESTWQKHGIEPVRVSSMHEAIEKLIKEEWLRRRIRMFIWKRWKRVRTRYKMLKKLGFNHNDAIKFTCSRKGYWRIANRHIMAISVTNERLRQAGYVFLSSYYNAVRA